MGILSIFNENILEISIAMAADNRSTLATPVDPTPTPEPNMSVAPVATPAPEGNLPNGKFRNIAERAQEQLRGEAKSYVEAPKTASGLGRGTDFVRDALNKAGVDGGQVKIAEDLLTGTHVAQNDIRSGDILVVDRVDRKGAGGAFAKVVTEVEKNTDGSPNMTLAGVWKGGEVAEKKSPDYLAGLTYDEKSKTWSGTKEGENVVIHVIRPGQGTEAPAKTQSPPPGTTSEPAPRPVAAPPSAAAEAKTAEAGPKTSKTDISLGDLNLDDRAATNTAVAQILGLPADLVQTEGSGNIVSRRSTPLGDGTIVEAIVTNANQTRSDKVNVTFGKDGQPSQITVNDVEFDPKQNPQMASAFLQALRNEKAPLTTEIAKELGAKPEDVRINDGLRGDRGTGSAQVKIGDKSALVNFQLGKDGTYSFGNVTFPSTTIPEMLHAGLAHTAGDSRELKGIVDGVYGRESGEIQLSMNGWFGGGTPQLTSSVVVQGQTKPIAITLGADPEARVKIDYRTLTSKLETEPMLMRNTLQTLDAFPNHEISWTGKFTSANEAPNYAAVLSPKPSFSQQQTDNTFQIVKFSPETDEIGVLPQISFNQNNGGELILNAGENAQLHVIRGVEAYFALRSGDRVQTSRGNDARLLG